MPVKTTHFRVDNGDMTLVEFESGRKLLIDIALQVVGAEEAVERRRVDTRERRRERTRARPGNAGRL